MNTRIKYFQIPYTFITETVILHHHTIEILKRKYRDSVQDSYEEQEF